MPISLFPFGVGSLPPIISPEPISPPFFLAGQPCWQGNGLLKDSPSSFAQASKLQERFLFAVASKQKAINKSALQLSTTADWTWNTPGLCHWLLAWLCRGLVATLIRLAGLRCFVGVIDLGCLCWWLWRIILSWTVASVSYTFQ